MRIILNYELEVVRLRWTVGDIILGYKILKVCEGGMGIVYIVFCQRWQKLFAFKTFKEELFWDERLMKRFEKEATTWVNLGKHTNIVQAIFVTEIEGKPYVLMEYCGEGSLADYVGKLTLPETLDFAIQFCEGMQYAYRKQSIIHRDIKPKNVLINKFNERKIYKIGDFGLAALLQEVSKDRAIDTDSKEISRGAGTWPYMPPEQFPEKILQIYSFPIRQVTVRTDIYAFGATLYEVVTGKPPFSSVNEIFTQEATDPQLLNPEIPKSLAQLIMQCLEKDPDRRPPTFQQIKNKLTDIYSQVTGRAYLSISKEEDLDYTALLQIAHSYVELNKYETALKLYDEALKKKPEGAEALCDKGGVLLKLNQIGEATKCIESSLKINPEDPLTLNTKAFLLYKLGQYEEALKYYDKALSITNKFLLMEEERIKILHNKASLLCTLRRYEQALDVTNEALRIHSRNPLTLAVKGKILANLGKFTEAIQNFDEALSLSPRNDSVWCERGTTLAMWGGLTKKVVIFSSALKCYRRALEINPNNARAWLGAGICFYILEEDNQARSAFQRVIEVSDPNDYEEKELTQEARKYLKKLS